MYVCSNNKVLCMYVVTRLVLCMYVIVCMYVVMYIHIIPILSTTELSDTVFTRIVAAPRIVAALE